MKARLEMIVFVAGIFLLGGAGAAIAQDMADDQNQDVMDKPDDSWISISGTVESSNSDSFVLNYGTGEITVEMDSHDNFGDAYGVVDQDSVTVYGRIDDGFFETRTIEASSVYVKGLNTSFYANAADEENASFWIMEPVVGQVVIRGTVVDTDLIGKGFDLDTGFSVIDVDGEDLPYDPFDDDGYQKIEVGDRVRVTGTLDNEFFDGLVLNAESVISLSSSNAIMESQSGR